MSSGQYRVLALLILLLFLEILRSGNVRDFFKNALTQPIQKQPSTGVAQKQAGAINSVK